MKTHQPMLTTGYRCLPLQLGLLALCLLLTWTLPARAQLDQPKTPVQLSSNRFLFVFDNSYAMRYQVKEIVTNFGKLIAGDACGQLRTGDTIGVWLFNEKLSSDLPLIEWAPDQKENIKTFISAYLHRQHFTGESKLSCVATNLGMIVRASDVLTTIIFCQGIGRVAGTPFDEPINDFLNSHGRRTKKDLPICIVLQSIHGKYTHYSISANPWPIEIPALPSPPPIVVAAPKKAVAEATKPAPPRPMAPPLIVIGPDPSTHKKDPAVEAKVDLSPTSKTWSETSNAVSAQPVAPVAANSVASTQAPTAPTPPSSENYTEPGTPVSRAAPVVPQNNLANQTTLPAAPTPVLTQPAAAQAPAKTAIPPSTLKQDSTPHVDTKESTLGSSTILIGSIIAGVLALVLGAYVWLKPSAHSEGSYITRSMVDRPKS